MAGVVTPGVSRGSVSLSISRRVDLFSRLALESVAGNERADNAPSGLVAAAMLPSTCLHKSANRHWSVTGAISWTRAGASFLGYGDLPVSAPHRPRCGAFPCVAARILGNSAGPMVKLRVKLCRVRRRWFAIRGPNNRILASPALCVPPDDSSLLTEGRESDEADQRMCVRSRRTQKRGRLWRSSAPVTKTNTDRFCFLSIRLLLALSASN